MQTPYLEQTDKNRFALQNLSELEYQVLRKRIMNEELTAMETIVMVEIEFAINNPIPLS